MRRLCGGASPRLSMLKISPKGPLLLKQAGVLAPFSGLQTSRQAAARPSENQPASDGVAKGLTAEDPLVSAVHHRYFHWVHLMDLDAC